MQAKLRFQRASCHQNDVKQCHQSMMRFPGQLQPNNSWERSSIGLPLRRNLLRGTSRRGGEI